MSGGGNRFDKARTLAWHIEVLPVPTSPTITNGCGVSFTTYLPEQVDVCVCVNERKREREGERESKLLCRVQSRMAMVWLRLVGSLK